MKVYTVYATWDPEAEVFVASSDDVPGLATEADTVEALKAKLDTMVPELLQLNGANDREGDFGGEVLIEVAHYQEKLLLRA
jgi:Domain of unknown function (DUF1902)